jgi:hypothetical protein
LAVVALVAHWALVGCTSSDSDHTSPAATGGSAGAAPTQTGGSAGTAGSDGGAAPEPTYLGKFTVSLVDAEVEGSTNPPYTTVEGEIDDGPYPEVWLEIEQPRPADATPGCSVYKVVAPDCSGIDGCGIGSSNTACAQAAVTGINSCICVAQDECQPYPTAKNVGDVTVSGVRTISLATSFQLVNVGNTYQVAPGTLAFPGFGEGDTIGVSATGGEYEAFEIFAPGIAKLTLTNEPFHLARDPAFPDDPTKFLPLTVTWIPPGPASTASINVELNISRHAGTVGFLECEVEDTGSLILSASLVSQLATLGNIAGFPELQVIRGTYESTTIAAGSIELAVEAFVERFPTIEGFTSCKFDTDCELDEVCNSSNKLCQPA